MVVVRCQKGKEGMERLRGKRRVMKAARYKVGKSTKS